jgi:hypothetical protein
MLLVNRLRFAMRTLPLNPTRPEFGLLRQKIVRQSVAHFGVRKTLLAVFAGQDPTSHFDLASTDGPPPRPATQYPD